MPKIEKQRKVLSCKHCRLKKIKCNYKTPCSNCIRLGVQCEPVSYDRRRKKLGNSYISALENQIRTMRSFLVKVKNADSQGRDQMLNNYSVPSFELELTDANKGNPNQPEETQNDTNYDAPIVNENNVIIEPTSGGIEVYGQSSVFIPQPNEIETQASDSFDFSSFHYSTIFTYISNFFKWQYPDYNVYIHRESFLMDFFREKNDIKKSLPYCSEELIYAICASGSSIHMGENMVIIDGVLYDSPNSFYCKSREILFHKLSTGNCNSITVIQTFLCLAFFDLGRGKNLSAWILSGIAFRIGLHMGFSLDPTKWKNILHPLSEYDIKVKSRIYWGCCIADHIISLVLGRIPMLKNSHATIPESEDLPVLPGIEYFMYTDPLQNKSLFNISAPLKYQSFLYNIASKFQKKCFLPRSNVETKLTSIEVLHHLSNFNMDLMKWKDSLPDPLSWTKMELKDSSYNPNIMSIRYQYYMLLLSFNRPFITETYASKELTTSPITICASVIDDIYYSIVCFKMHNSLKCASLNIVFLSILSISVLQKLSLSIRLPLKKNTLITFFGSVLEECSTTWGLSKRAYDSFGVLFDKIDKEEKSLKMASVISTGEAEVLPTNNDSSLFGDLFEFKFEFEISDMEDSLLCLNIPDFDK